MKPVNNDGNFQDWETVTFKKGPNKKNNKDAPKLSDEEIRLRKVENSEDPQKQNKMNLKHCQLIQQGRLQKKVTQKDLANKLNVDVNTLSQYENGKIVPNRQILNKIARELNISFK